MAAVTGKSECVTCKKEKVVYTCIGCSQNFCKNHLAEHNQELGKQLDKIEDQRNIFRQRLSEQTTSSQQQSLENQINQWENNSIRKIQQSANEARQILSKHFNTYVNHIEKKLEQLTDQLRCIRKEDDFNEIVLNQVKQQLTQLEDDLSTPPTISIKEDASPFIGKISISTAPDLFEDRTNMTTTINAEDQSANEDEFEAGETHRIRRINSIIIPVRNDNFVGTICSHNNQLLYNDYDYTTQTYRLTFIRDKANPTKKQIIEWNQPMTIHGDNNDLIQDIAYSNALACYLVLGGKCLYLFNDGTKRLTPFHIFANQKMKRLACNDKYIYLVSSSVGIPLQADEIILLNYKSSEQVRKAFWEIMPARSKKDRVRSMGEISDLAVGANGQVMMGFRIDSRKEVGVHLFRITSDGGQWSYVKTLLLNECWHESVPYTPRMDWSEKLNVFVLVEYLTGHLIMIDQNGQVTGECRFMCAQNQRESPLNLAFSSNDCLCVRYESSINIHKLI